TGGYYRFTNLLSGMALDVAGGCNTPSETTVQQWPSNFATGQQWSLTDMGSGQYKIASNCGTGMVLDVPSGSGNGALVKHAIDNGSSRQRCTLTSSRGGGSPTINASPSSVGGGGSVAINWTGSTTIADWVAIWTHNQTNGSPPPSNWVYTSSCTKSYGSSVVSSGSCNFTAPSSAAIYDIRLNP